MVEVIVASKGFFVGFLLLLIFVFLVDYHGTTWGHGRVAELLGVGAHLESDTVFYEDNSLRRKSKYIVKWGLNSK